MVMKDQHSQFCVGGWVNAMHNAKSTAPSSASGTVWSAALGDVVVLCVSCLTRDPECSLQRKLRLLGHVSWTAAARACVWVGERVSARTRMLGQGSQRVVVRLQHGKKEEE